MYVLITQLLSGLALFLFGMKYMSDSLQQAAGGRLRTILDRCTRNKYIAVVCGALFTAFIQSSGATTVMEVGFVNAGIMTLEQCRNYIWCEHWYNNYITACFIETYSSGTIYYFHWCGNIIIL